MLAYHIQEVRQDMADKEKVLSVLIKKKQSRYKKIPGTKILQMNNPSNEAKSFLGTSHLRKTDYKEPAKRLKDRELGRSCETEGP